MQLYTVTSVISVDKLDALGAGGKDVSQRSEENLSVLCLEPVGHAK